MEKKPVVISDKQAKSLYQGAVVVLKDFRLEAEGMEAMIASLRSQLENAEKVISALRTQLSSQEALFNAKTVYAVAERGVLAAQTKALSELNKIKFDIPRDQRSIW